MPGNYKDGDLRIQRTNKVLMEAMSKLLGLRNFNKITVNDICVEAQISRATFYSHFLDKYDLLEHWLAKTKAAIIYKNAANKDTGKRINDFVNNSGISIRHLIEDANGETLGLLCDFMLSLLDMDKTVDGQNSPKHIVLSKFYCGGIMNYLEWLATSKSKIDSDIMNSYFYDIIQALDKLNEE